MFQNYKIYLNQESKKKQSNWTPQFIKCSTPSPTPDAKL